MFIKKLNIVRPTLLVDEKIVESNILRMQNKAEQLNASFRPHFKTHQSNYFGDFFRKFGITKIAVSSLKMAEYFAENKWTDILVAFPVNILEIDLINSLSEKIKLSVFAEDSSVLQTLNNQLQNTIDIFIKIDVGYGRTGIEIENITKIIELVNFVQNSKKLNFKGFAIHAGHSYKTTGKANLIALAKEIESKILKFRDKISKHINNYEISFGDTPILSTVEQLKGIDEIRPGNFIFYDAMQLQLESCDFKNIAVGLAAPVVAKHCDRNEIVLYAGGIHLSKENILNENGTKNFGLISIYSDNSWQIPLKNVYIKSLSQEHAIISIPNALCNKINIGDVLHIIPIHSCLTANLMGKYINLQGKEILMFRY